MPRFVYGEAAGPQNSSRYVHSTDHLRLKSLTFGYTLPDRWMQKLNGYVNYWAAQALLSRVYLDMGEYQSAYDAATDVIENNGGLYRLYTQSEYASTDLRIALPIPQSEIDAHPNMVQNVR